MPIKSDLNSLTCLEKKLMERKKLNFSSINLTNRQFYRIDTRCSRKLKIIKENRRSMKLKDLLTVIMRNPMTFVLKFLKIQISSGRISKESSKLNLLYSPLFSDQESFSLTSEVSKRCRKLRRSSKSNFLIKSSNGQK